VVGQECRYDFETSDDEFQNMMDTQRIIGGYLPEKDVDNEEFAPIDVEKVQGG
jgi:hypothetical protein